MPKASKKSNLKATSKGKLDPVTPLHNTRAVMRGLIDSSSASGPSLASPAVIEIPVAEENESEDVGNSHDTYPSRMAAARFHGKRPTSGPGVHTPEYEERGFAQAAPKDIPNIQSTSKSKSKHVRYETPIIISSDEEIPPPQKEEVKKSHKIKVEKTTAADPAIEITSKNDAHREDAMIDPNGIFLQDLEGTIQKGPPTECGVTKLSAIPQDIQDLYRDLPPLQKYRVDIFANTINVVEFHVYRKATSLSLNHLKRHYSFDEIDEFIHIARIDPALLSHQRFGQSDTIIVKRTQRPAIFLLFGITKESHLLHPTEIKDQLAKKIHIEALENDWERMISVIGTVFDQADLFYYTWLGALVISTKWAPSDSSSRSVRKSASPSKPSASTSYTSKAPTGFKFVLDAFDEVPIYDFRIALDLKKLDNARRYEREPPFDSAVVVAFTLSKYKSKDGKLVASPNMRWVGVVGDMRCQ